MFQQPKKKPKRGGKGRKYGCRKFKPPAHGTNLENVHPLTL
jgi:hypothetical protein